jgi:hypothetical protein
MRLLPVRSGDHHAFLLQHIAAKSGARMTLHRDLENDGGAVGLYPWSDTSVSEVLTYLAEAEGL